MRVNIEGVFGEIDSLPGCSQVGVSHAVFLPIHKRGEGTGKLAHKKRLEYMKQELGYDYALCTVDKANTRQIAILEANGWKELDKFNSSKTFHAVALYGKILTGA